VTAIRMHWVFTYSCGCPFGLVERTDRRQTEDSAWKSMFETRTKERSAVSRGVQAVFVEHDTYKRDFYPLMTKTCPHEEGQ
jgi:hypothetical protein